MCEYCGCQALETIDELTREHERVVTLISHIRDARGDGAIARMAELARAITSVLGPHTRVEERGLFPALAGDFPEQIVALEDEHRRIEAVLAEADGPFLTDPAWPDRLVETLALLREHILKEQDGVFPAALAHLDTEQWEAVEKVRAEAGSALSRPPA
ncbi:hemerythrin domain-containing protein [Streptomyces sp. NPDC007907]|uniref:hemerythrin domain-containing protein n=1 Tax=Streptomyces sp. NPDC007907 TaxID=3364789 RepID=UPI0036EAC271